MGVTSYDNSDRTNRSPQGGINVTSHTRLLSANTTERKRLRGGLRHVTPLGTTLVARGGRVVALDDTETLYDKMMYNHWGRDRDGFDRDGLSNGYDRHGFNSDGFDRDGHDRHGFTSHGRGRDGYDRRGFDYDRKHRNGTSFDDNGFNMNGLHRNGTRYDPDGYNRAGYDMWGLDRVGNPKNYLSNEETS